ncbi:unnamed protein product [Rhizoctonia solani]|uniref:CHAT domain-containing protein n=1 Tax=Rhizoctonia solani TaxID=456999 RepID=A0A8H3GV47_9AGAM|nr:unnamed protein product [Rhizoctonia solani]
MGEGQLGSEDSMIVRVGAQRQTQDETESAIVKISDKDPGRESAVAELDSSTGSPMDSLSCEELNKLGSIHLDQFRQFGKPDDIAKAIEYSKCALDFTPDGHPEMPLRLTGLAVCYGDRFRRFGKIEDTEKAIECGIRALALTPDDDPNLPLQLFNLGVSYIARYQRLGELSDLEKSFEHRCRAVTLAPDGHPHLPRWYAGLGGVYTDRYRHLGELGDIERSIEYNSRALTLTPDGHPDLPSRHGELGQSYSDRYRRLGEFNDLNESIKHRLCALALTPDGHPDLQDWYGDLGVSHRYRYEYLWDLEDLEKSIEYKTRALMLTPENHPELPHRHNNLGVSYTYRFRHLSEVRDLERAKECYFRALALTPDGHPRLSLRHFNLAISCYDHYRHTDDPSHLHISLNSFRKATKLAGAPRDAFDYALRWTQIASTHSLLNCIEAFQTAIDLLPHFIWLGTTTTQRYQDLSLADNVAIRAASAAILASEYNLALEWLEHARCVVWNQSLMLRSPLDDLKLSYPDLATQLQSVAHQLNHANSESSASPATDTPESRHRLAKQHEGLLAQVRKLAGFENFLQPAKVHDLMRAARNGPVVVINCYETRCDALLILPEQDQISHLALFNFPERKARHARSEINQFLQQKGLRVRRPVFDQSEELSSGISSVLATLWYDVVKPILEFLGYINDNSTDNLPHITWCLTGAMSFLPLHAAGDYDQSRSRVFDYVISSYTPTLSALINSASPVIDRVPNILAIGQEATPGHSLLPGTTSELAHVRAHTKGRAECSQLVGSQATTKTVLDAMEQHDWVHLACHAHQNVSDPTSSGFFLHDGVLDLSTINRRSFRNKGLAFLSACQTATGDETLPDEAIHLASGMLMAGYRSVIGTMWSLVDDDAPFVADKLYARLMQEGKLANGEAGKALHDAVAGLRNMVGEQDFSRWMPYIHIGS